MVIRKKLQTEQVNLKNMVKHTVLGDAGGENSVEKLNKDLQTRRIEKMHL